MQFGIEAIANIQPIASGGSSSPPTVFASLMQQGLGELNGSLNAAEGAVSDLAAGRAVELHDVMISLERARLSVQTFVQVRNKLIESYQDLMRMQL